jgi:hypothetical protein
LALPVESLAKDFFSAQGIVVARPVEVDDVAVARILKNWTAA